MLFLCDISVFTGGTNSDKAEKFAAMHNQNRFIFFSPKGYSVIMTNINRNWDRYNTDQRF